jgi:5-methylcytosine-specific restriction endonuclease McrA
MNSALRAQVRQRANGLCEYCQLPDTATELPHEADHIRTIKHDGPTELANLCWACARCNDFKGSDAAAYIPGTDQLVHYRPLKNMPTKWTANDCGSS